MRALATFASPQLRSSRRSSCKSRSPKFRRSSQALGLGLIALLSPGCGDPESLLQDADPRSETSELGPPLGGTTTGAVQGPEISAGDWQPSFEEATSEEAKLESSSSTPSTTGTLQDSSAPDNSSGQDSGASTQEQPGDDTPGTGNPTDEVPGQTPDTETGSTGDNPDDSSEGEPPGDETPTPGDTPTLDPKGPQFGFQIDLSIPDPPLPDSNYRVLVFEFQAQNSELETPRAQPEVSELELRSVQPKVRFTSAGRASFILSSPDRSQLNAETGRSKPHAVAIYLDRNDDGAWSDNEAFIAVLPHSLVYEQANAEHPERWRMTKAGALGAKQLLDPEALLSAVPQTLPLLRLDAARSSPSIEGALENVRVRGVDFLAMVSQAEREDLANRYWSGHRPFDLYLRGKSASSWAAQPTGLPAGTLRAPPVIEIPGIKPEFTVTNWLVGYRRAIGAPLEEPNKFLTPDSEIIAEVCGAGQMVGFWIQEGAWASSPLGALYASWFSLGVGWGLVDANPQSAPFYYFPQLGLPLNNCSVKRKC